MSRITMSLFVVFFALSSAAEAQRGQEKASGPKPMARYAQGDVALHYYRPHTEKIQAHTLVGGASQVLGRSFFIEGSSRPVHNLLAIGDAVVVYDTPENAKRILGELRKLEEVMGSDARSAGASSNDQEEGEYESVVIWLRHISAHAAYQALESFQRPIIAGKRSPRNRARNMQVLAERNVLIVRDTPANIAKIQKMVAKIDIEAEPKKKKIPGLLITCHILRSVKDSKGGSDLPVPLAENLSKLLPGMSFERMGVGILRAGLPARQLGIEMDLGDGFRAELEMKEVKGEGSDVTLKDLSFGVQGSREDAKEKTRYPVRHSIRTNTVISLGDYTVIGAFGGSPWLLVLRVTEA